jgi:hypothetical protein
MKLNFLLAILLGSLTLHAAVIYQQDFEASSSLPTGFSGAGAIETTGGLSAFGLGNNHLRNAGNSATQLSLSGLAAHSTIKVTFDLVLWDSVDAFSDVLRYSIGSIIGETFIGNYGSQLSFFNGPGTLISDPFTAFAVPNYGQNPGFRDQARRVVFSFLHSDPSVNITWAYTNSQGGTDESFGIDNVLVETNAEENSAVPEPATIVLTGIALTVLTLRKRR